MKKSKYSLIISLGILIILIIITFITVSLILNHHQTTNKQMTVKFKTITSKKPFNLNELTSLKNYSFAITDNHSSFNGSVYSSNNWSIKQPILEEHINHFIYIEISPNNWHKIPEGNNNYSQSPFISSAKNFLNFYHVAGTHLVEGQSCQIDHIQGSIYSFFGPSLHQKNQTQIIASACLANQSHNLLAFNLGTSTNFINQKSKNISFSFRITGINQTKKLTLPNHLN